MAIEISNTEWKRLIEKYPSFKDKTGQQFVILDGIILLQTPTKEEAANAEEIQPTLS
jgi:hypothetical protein